ncbi:MAG: radical SAM family heme chaperone HemW [Actinobacteria bacterium]|nr:MAG: radical SAM family heme chaperone HemW [Actinomycetota bacterium]
MSSPGDIPTLPEHLYVHVPLCRTKCAYCDFFSLSRSDLPLSVDALTSALVNQACAWGERGLSMRPLQTLYVGGGTPSMLGAALAGLVDAIGTHIGFATGAEITVEANPDSIDDQLVSLLAEAGVTRVSLGVQSFHDDVLHTLGRAHDATRAIAAARSVRAWNLDLSVDLMCGIPGQSMGSWLASVEYAIATGAGHVSVYPLSLESGTPLAAEMLLGRFAEPDPDVAADMMIAANEVLAREGFERYEVANYAKPGAQSRHNTAYWTGHEYLGVGPGAHGMLTTATARAAGFIVPEDAARVRYAIACDLQTGLQPAPRADIETLTAGEAAREDVMLGLRLTTGVDVALVERAGVAGLLGRLAGTGLVERSDDRWRLTEGGWLLGNEVFGDVWAGE